MLVTHNIPHTTDLHQILRLPCKMTLTMSHACQAICTLSPLDAALTMRSAIWRSGTKKSIHLPKTTEKHYLRRSQKTTFHELWNMLECHEVPCLPRETSLFSVGNLQKWPLLKQPPWARHPALMRNVERTHPQPSDPACGKKVHCAAVAETSRGILAGGMNSVNN